MRDPNPLALLGSLLIVVAASGPVCAQGAGVVGTNGLEPRITIAGRAAGALSTVTVGNLVSQAPMPSLSLGVSVATALIDLGPAGLPGAVLGIDLAAGTVTPPLPVPASGEIPIAFTVPPALAGMTFYLQAAALDPGANALGITLSDAVPLTFGTAPQSAIVTLGATAGGLAPQRLFADGQTTGPVLPPLTGLTLLGTTLAARFPGVPLRADLPYRDLSEPARPRVHLPDGGALYRYVDGVGQHGLFVVRDGGEDFHHLLQVSQPIVSVIAVSPFEPLAAVLTENAVPEAGGAGLFLLRTDGENLPGLATPWSAVTFSGPLATYEPEDASLTFLQGALLMSDKTALVRLATDLQTPPELVPLPLSGGLAPADVDEELAWSDDGSTAAFSAGADDENRDLYVVGPTGPATNVTQNPGEIENVDYAGPQGGLLALAPDGSRVAYVLKTAVDEDVMVHDTVAGSPATNATNPQDFGNSLESEGGLSFATATDLRFANGLAPNQQDLYRVTLGAAGTPPVAVANLTGTSGVLAPPFTLGGTLSFKARVGLPGGGSVYQLDEGPGSAMTLVLDDTDPLTPATVLTGISAVNGATPTASGPLLGLAQGGGSQLVRVAGDGSITSVVSAAVGETFGAVVAGSSGEALLVTDTGAGQSATRIDAANVATPIAGLSAPLVSPAVGFLADGTLLVATTDVPGTTLHSVALDGTTTILLQTPDPILVL